MVKPKHEASLRRKSGSALFRKRSSEETTFQKRLEKRQSGAIVIQVLLLHHLQLKRTLFHHLLKS